MQTKNHGYGTRGHIFLDLDPSAQDRTYVVSIPTVISFSAPERTGWALLQLRDRRFSDWTWTADLRMKAWGIQGPRLPLGHTHIMFTFGLWLRMFSVTSNWSWSTNEVLRISTRDSRRHTVGRRNLCHVSRSTSSNVFLNILPPYFPDGLQLP